MSDQPNATPNSLTQRLVLALLPRKWREDLVRESQQWQMTCSICSSWRSVWEAGGIRWKAAGSVILRVKCLQCDCVTTHHLEREPGSN